MDYINSGRWYYVANMGCGTARYRAGLSDGRYCDMDVIGEGDWYGPFVTSSDFSK
jgi:hypothetical protein